MATRPSRVWKVSPDCAGAKRLRTVTAAAAAAASQKASYPTDPFLAEAFVAAPPSSCPCVDDRRPFVCLFHCLPSTAATSSSSYVSPLDDASR